MFVSSENSDICGVSSEPLLLTNVISTVPKSHVLTHIFNVLPAKSDSDIVFCLQLLNKTLTCTLHLS